MNEREWTCLYFFGIHMNHGEVERSNINFNEKSMQSIVVYLLSQTLNIYFLCFMMAPNGIKYKCLQIQHEVIYLFYLRFIATQTYFFYNNITTDSESLPCKLQNQAIHFRLSLYLFHEKNKNMKNNKNFRFICRNI
jgi:ABC-type anion transport system duplicated permease subunit